MARGSAKPDRLKPVPLYEDTVSNPPPKIRVAFCGAFDPRYPRHQIIIAGLERVGVEVKPVMLPRKIAVWRQVFHLLRRTRELRDCDLIFIPAFNQLLAPFVWLLSLWLRKPVLLDYMIGLTDSMVDERQTPSPLKAALYKLIDRFNLARITALTDTEAHIRLFRSFAVVKTMFPLPVGVYDDWFHPEPIPDGPTCIQFFGSYLPFHGVEIILDAAAEFRDRSDIIFEIIGNGQTFQRCQAYAETLRLTQVRFVDVVPPEVLPARVAQATICLGVFGARPKTDYVVPNKVFQCMALGRPVVTADSTALREIFVPGQHLVMVRPGDSHALAAALRDLLDSPAKREQVGQSAAQLIQTVYLPQHIGLRLKPILLHLIKDYPAE
jgi:glycosyltransferase involved in cell wall biosynthesis